jgi:hypothetical protein
VELGDLAGLEDYELGIELGQQLNSPEAASGMINLADTLMDLGDLERARQLRAAAQRAAERSGDAKSIRWLRAEHVGEHYWFGEWDDAVALADAFIAESESGRRHYQETYCRVIRGRIRLVRGDVAGALDDAAKADEFARVIKDPQALLPVLAFQARALLRAGREEEAAEAASSLLTLVREIGKTPVAYLWLLDAALALTDLGRGAELVEAIAAVGKATPWLEAARAIAAGDPGRGADIYAQIGATPDEALARGRALARIDARHSRADIARGAAAGRGL